jgi:hypothetical protein
MAYPSVTERIRSNPELMRVFRVLWGDTVESKVDVIDATVTSNDSKIDVLDTKVSLLVPTVVTSSLISTGTITLSTAGNYALGENITADIEITASSISLDLNNRVLTGMIIIDGGVSNITDVEVHNGFMLPPAPFSVPIAGITVDDAVSRVNLFDIIVECTSTTAPAVAGRTGMQIAGDEVTITNCHITAGAAGNSTGAGFDGGDGIELTSSSTNAIIRDCALFGGNGGDADDGSPAGRGGHGIYVNAASNAQISDCLILITGVGGDNSNNNGGDGGDGIHITSTADDIEVTGCTLRNTGAAGVSTGAGGPGTAGRAINDLVPAADPGKSIILSNIGHNIANTTIRFNIGNAGSEQGVALTYPPTTTAVNVYANVYIA